MSLYELNLQKDLSKRKMTNTKREVIIIIQVMEVRNQMKVTGHIKDIITKNIIKADEMVCFLDDENFSSFLCQI